MSAGIERKKAVWMILFLSVLSPLGQVLGMLLGEMNTQVQGVFMAISAGTFVYIATAEIIIEEFSFSKFKYLKFFMYCVGILFIAIITAYAD